jgi:glycosyltransferase involved in cell wall biosynthesis
LSQHTKRIAVIGNMNNNMFAVTRYLRGAGLDAHLFYRPADHFQPKADTFSIDFLSYCHEVDWLNKGDFEIDIEKVKKDIKGYQFYIGQGYEAAVAMRAGIAMDIYFPYGSDVYKYAYLPQKYSLAQRVYMRVIKKIPLAATGKGTSAFFMRKTIREAKNIYLDYVNDDFEKKLSGLNINGKSQNIPMPFIYYPEYEKAGDWDVHWRTPVDELRKKNDFILLYHGRQEWKIAKTYKNNDFTGKNTNHLIIGFAEFVKSNPAVNACLAMLEYGGDVANSKALVQELGIEENVVWFPKMYRKDLMYLIKNVDLCSGEFGKSYLTFGTIIEAMLMEKPVIHYRQDDLYTDKYNELYPLYNAREPEQITNALNSAFNDAAKRIEMGKQARAWVMKNFIEIPLQKIIETINHGALKDAGSRIG